MKELGMSLEEIKSTPRYELEGLLRGLSNFNTIHAFDGYDDKDIGSIAKNKPQVRSEYAKSLRMKAKYDSLTGITAKKQEQQTRI